MRIQKISVLTLVAVAAGLSLTACDKGSDNSSASVSSSSSTADNQGASAKTKTDSAAGAASGTSVSKSSGSGSGSTSGSGTASVTGTDPGAPAGPSGSTCRTANLSFTTSGGMAEGELIVNMKNTGSSTCTMHGFPGVDLKGHDGTVSATRTKINAPDVKLASGEETRFTLHYPENNTGGSGVTFTSLIVTPPNETHSHTIHTGINIPANSDSAPTITVDPVGSGK
ncbi:DUF4232 domain-containing protein [Streptomyces sp. DW26H14]|uniref:DUF4232 domain-containing protein n=1 Tax=Streptomyces sp. DW26H14 TaxID=3435395 RepID=UPI00403E2718